MTNRFVCLVLSCLISFSAFVGCTPENGAKDPSHAEAGAVPRGVVLAYGGAYAAWAVLDELERVRLKALNDKGDPALAAAELPKAELRNARLHRIRIALTVARGYVAGEKSLEDCREALRDAATLLKEAVAEVRAAGAKVPPEVDAGLAAVSALL